MLDLSKIHLQTQSSRVLVLLILAALVCINQTNAQQPVTRNQRPVGGVQYTLGDVPAVRAGYFQEEGEEAEENDPEVDELDMAGPGFDDEEDEPAIEEAQVAEDDYQLPQLADVNDPISLAPLGNTQQYDPSQLLTETYQEQVMGNGLTYSGLTGRPSIPTTARWAAPNFYHRPLMFEEQNLERYGNELRHQNVASAVNFFKTIPSLPYQAGSGVNRRVYTLGRGRPGNYVPYEVERFQRDQRGSVWQAAAAAAIIFP